MQYINGYNKKYSIANDGKVWSHIRNRFLTKHKNRQGYWVVTLVGLGKNKRKLKTHYIHRLVADAFLAQKEGKNVVNHIDGNKENNHISNLEWVTQKENVAHSWNMGTSWVRSGDKHPNVKLNSNQIKEVKSKLTGKYGNMTSLAQEYEVSVSLISLINKGYRI